MKIFYEGNYTLNENGGIDQKKYKEWAKVVKEDFEKFKEIILPNYDNNKGLENLCNLIINNIQNEYSCDKNTKESSIFVFDKYVILSFYSQNKDTTPYELYQIIYNRNFKEFYKSMEQFYIDRDDIGKYPLINILKYSIEENEVVTNYLKHIGYIDTKYEDSLETSLKKLILEN